MEPVTDTEATASGQNGTAAGQTAPKATNAKRGVRYPIQLRVNLTVEMAASLARLAQYREMPEGIICREILKQHLLQVDAQYRHAIGLNTGNQQHG